jgi:hypothetical protein
MAIMSFLPGWTRRDIEHGQNAFQRDRIKDRRNTNHMPTRMNDLDRRSDGKGKSDGKERRAIPLAAAITARVGRPAIPRRSGPVPTSLAQGSPPPIEPMFGNPFLGTESLRS